MKKTLIIYHSGSGSTKTVSQVLREKLSKSFKTKLLEVNLKFNYQILLDYDFIVFGFPTYHCEPSTTMMDFLKQMPVFNKPLKSFIFTTFGLYPGNSLRIFIKLIITENNL